MDTSGGQAQLSLTWFEIWRIAFLRPTTRTFLQIINDPKASIRWGILWMAITALIAWFVNPLTAIFDGYIVDMFGLQAEIYFQIIGPVAAILLSMIGLLVTAAISHGFARLFAGAGTFPHLVYCWGVMLLPFILLAGLGYRLPSLLIFFSRSFALSTAGIIMTIISLLIFIGVNLFLFYAEVVAFSAIEKFRVWKGFAILFLEAFVVAIAASFLSAGFNVLMMKAVY
jgi:hypothetical protein